MTLTNAQLSLTIVALVTLGQNYTTPGENDGSRLVVYWACRHLRRLGWDDEAIGWLFQDINNVRRAYVRAKAALAARQ